MSAFRRLAARFVWLLPAATFATTACSDSLSPVDSRALASGRGSGSSAEAADFAILANAAVTCTDGAITGDVGTYLAAPTGSVTLTNCPVTGTVHVGDASSRQAFDRFLVTYAALAPRPGDVCTTLTGTLAGVTLPPGVYCFPAAATLTGVLTLDGPSNGTWIFKIGTGGTGALTGTNFTVEMAGGGEACNVTWWVAQAADMTDSHLKGTILAGAAITLTRGSLSGNAWSKADVTVTGTAVDGCEGVSPPSCTPSGGWVTGGGWILGPSGSKANFAVAGGFRREDFWGHLTYVDHGSRGSSDDIRVKGTGVVAYVVVDAVTRHIEGTATVNGQPGFTYQVDVADNGEPGRDDTFSLWLSNGYSASGTLRGGNIQLHRSRRDACATRGGRWDFDDDDDDDDDD